MRSALKGGISAATFVLVIAVVLSVTGWFPSISLPFRAERTITDHAAVLQSLEDLAEYHAATGTYQVVVEVEDRYRYVPSFVAGERTTFLAEGSVDAYVDLSDLGTSALTVSDDGTSVRVVLPPARLDDAVIDHEASGVLDRDRGLLDRAAGVLSDNPTSEMDVLVLAEEDLERAAAESGLVERAEDNTAALVEGLLGQLGFDDVRVVFAEPAVPPAT